MKKFVLTLGALIIASGAAQAGILSNFFGFNTYNNGYYYPPNYVRYTNNGYYPYNSSYYNRGYYPAPRYRYNNYYNRYPGNYYRRPIIYKTKVNRTSLNNLCDKKVASKVSGLDKIERKILSQTYEYDSYKNRIERLEQKVFGAIQSGDLQERFLTLKSVASNYKAYNPNMNNYSYNTHYGTYSGYRPPILTGTMGGGWQNNLWSNFKNQFVGMPTGITPAMDPAYMDYFEAERAMMGSGTGTDVDYRSNTGYYKSNTNTHRTTGMGVTILD